MIEKITVKYDGELLEIDPDQLDVGDINSADNQELLAAVAQHVGAESLSEFVVQRFDTVINVSPDPVYGKWK